MKKKIVSITLAVLAVFTFTTVAFAGYSKVYGDGLSIFSEYVESQSTKATDKIVFTGKSYTAANLNLIDKHIMQMIADDLTENRTLYTGTLEYDILNTKSLTYNCLIPTKYHSYQNTTVGVTYYKGVYAPYNQFIVAHSYVDFGFRSTANNEASAYHIAQETKKAEISRAAEIMRTHCNDKIFESFSVDNSKYLNVSGTFIDFFEGRHVYQILSQIGTSAGDTIPGYYYDEATEAVTVVKQDNHANNYIFMFELNECGDYILQNKQITKADCLYPEEYIATNLEYAKLIGKE